MSPDRASWAAPLLRLDRALVTFETSVAVFAIAAEALSMTLWVVLKGLATPADNASGGGVLFRSLAAAAVGGAIAHVVLRRSPTTARTRVAFVVALVFAVVGRATAAFGVAYFGNVLNFLQQASSLTLLGGLRGTATRFTLLLAMVGGSLATARGKHVIVDVVSRIARPPLRRYLVVASFLASSSVAMAAAFGFFDHIAIQDFDADADAHAAKKAEKVIDRLAEDAFIARAQLLLDLKTVPHVILRAEPYAEWLRGEEWNTFLAARGFDQRYGREATDALRIAPAESRAPLVSVPGRGEPRGELINAANLVYPVGLTLIGLRFLLRAVLVLTGLVSAEPDEEDEPSAPPGPAPNEAVPS